jgi:hypothetical protein
VLVSERFRNFVEESKFLSAEDKRIITALKADPDPFTNGQRSIFTQAFLERVTRGWAANLREIDDEARRLYGRAYLAVRYEDLLADPFTEIGRVWKFLGGKTPGRALAKQVQLEMGSNPDEEWQSERNEGIASFLPKGRAGNWQRLFTARDRAVFKEIAGELLVHWKYEKNDGW